MQQLNTLHLVADTRAVGGFLSGLETTLLQGINKHFYDRGAAKAGPASVKFNVFPDFRLRAPTDQQVDETL